MQTFGKYLMMQLIFLVCSFKIFTNGRRRMRFMNGMLGYAFMVFRFMHGILIFFKLCVMDRGRFIQADE